MSNHQEMDKKISMLVAAIEEKRRTYEEFMRDINTSDTSYESISEDPKLFGQHQFYHGKATVLDDVLRLIRMHLETGKDKP